MKPKRSYPADALGIRVELIDGPIYYDNGKKTAGSQIKSDTLVHVDRRLCIEDRRRCATLGRQYLLEKNLPKAEMEALARDLAAVERKIRRESPVADPMPLDGYQIRRHPVSGCVVCPCCGKAYSKRAGCRLWSHLRIKHDMEVLDGRWLPKERVRHLAESALENLRKGVR